MSQHNLRIENLLGAPLRANLNEAFAAVKSRQSGPTAPSNPVKYQEWVNSTNDRLMVFDGSRWRDTGSIF